MPKWFCNVARPSCRKNYIFSYSHIKSSGVPCGTPEPLFVAFTLGLQRADSFHGVHAALDRLDIKRY